MAKTTVVSVEQAIDLVSKMPVGGDLMLEFKSRDEAALFHHELTEMTRNTPKMINSVAQEPKKYDYRAFWVHRSNNLSKR